MDEKSERIIFVVEENYQYDRRRAKSPHHKATLTISFAISIASPIRSQTNKLRPHTTTKKKEKILKNKTQNTQIEDRTNKDDRTL